MTDAAAVDAVPAAAAGTRPWRPGLFPWFVAAGVFATGYMAVELARPNVGPPPGVRFVHFLVVAGFVWVGIFAWRRRPESPMGAIMAGVGLAYFLVPPHLSIPVSAFTFTLSNANQALYQAVMAHLALSFPTGRLGSRRDRWIVVGTYIWVIGNTTISQMFWDPGSSGCGCPRNLLLIDSSRFVDHLINVVTAVIGVVVAVVVLTAIVQHWRRIGVRGRRAFWPITLVAAPAVLLIIAQNIVQLTNAGYVAWLVLFGYGPAVFLLLPGAFLVTVLRSRLDRSAVADLVVELEHGVPAGELQAAIGRALGDPAARVAFLRSDEDAYVDPGGRPVEVRPGAGVTFLNEGHTIALLHDEALDDEPDLLRAVGAAARMALENERLRAEIRAQLEEVRASRQRIVEAGDAERRRVERNLHDGAQQRLLTLSLSLRLTLERLGPDADPAITAELDQAAAEAAAAVEELRELGRGIHPAVLTGSGLTAALEALAERSAVPVTVEAESNGRLPEPVEVTAYFVVSEALANCQRHANATRVRVVTSRSDGLLVVTVADDGVGGAETGAGSGLTGLQDRVAAVGGRLTVSSPPGGGTTVRAEIPCG
ncbi:MAG TPA: ATP-binding protein [Actinomycetota bacterium]|jgi:signal transduction histidine kinase